MDKYPSRVAASRGIPDTKFLGRAPQGLNATGISDEKNYQTFLETTRKNKMRQVMRLWTEVLSRHVGSRVSPQFTWPPLFEDTPKEQAETAKLKAEAIDVAVKAMVIDEDEGREMLNGDPVFGELSGPAPEPDPEDLMMDMPKMPVAAPSGNGNGRPKAKV